VLFPWALLLHFFFLRDFWFVESLRPTPATICVGNELSRSGSFQNRFRSLMAIETGTFRWRMKFVAILLLLFQPKQRQSQALNALRLESED
jgi:hypothetical protein